MWTRSRGIEDLNSLVPEGFGFVLTQGVAINDAGTILATGRDDDGHGDGHGNHEAPARVFLLVPEP